MDKCLSIKGDVCELTVTENNSFSITRIYVGTHYIYIYVYMYIYIYDIIYYVLKIFFYIDYFMDNCFSMVNLFFTHENKDFENNACS